MNVFDLSLLFESFSPWLAYDSHHFESILNDSCVRVPVCYVIPAVWTDFCQKCLSCSDHARTRSGHIEFWTKFSFRNCFYVTHSPGYHFGVLFEGVFCSGPRVPRDDVLDVCPHLEFMIPPRRVARLSQHCSWIQDTSLSQVVWRSFQHFINLKTSTSIQFHYHSPNLRALILKLLLALDLGLRIKSLFPFLEEFFFLLSRRLKWSFP